MLTDGEIVLRLVLAALMGGIIGLERERRRSTAGLRTHMLVSLGSSLLMVISILIPERLGGTANYGDSIRLAAGVVTGIGFLGAGTIIKHGSTVKGLTTAASIWVASALGLTIGAGFIYIAAVVLLLIILALIGLKGIDNYLAKKYGMHIIYMKVRGVGGRPPAISKLGSMLGGKLRKVEVIGVDENGIMEVEIFTESTSQEELASLLSELGRSPEVVRLEAIY
ncbi:MAG: MgtC/SapB family protein [Thermoplasmata archaeon]|nr:MgtC/SapB family protein [Thermoplasmata archaeon]